MQGHFIDSFIAIRESRLDKINTEIKWYRVEKLLQGLRDKPDGRPGYGALLLVKALLLQQWYSLSDLTLEEALFDRASFRRFLGLNMADRVPDSTTICRFRDDLSKLGLAEKIFSEITNQFEKKGIVLKKGTLIDASLIEGLPSDPEKGLTSRDGVKIEGYKAHVGVDEGSGIVRQAELTTIEVHDSQKSREMVNGDEQKVYADKAYDSQSFRNYLFLKGIEDGVMRREFGKKFPEVLEKTRARNKSLGKIRSGVERVFAWLKNHCDFRKTRYIGLIKNRSHLFLKLSAYNIIRALAIKT